VCFSMVTISRVNTVRRLISMAVSFSAHRHIFFRRVVHRFSPGGEDTAVDAHDSLTEVDDVNRATGSLGVTHCLNELNMCVCVCMYVCVCGQSKTLSRVTSLSP
jgi:hypothetical protein